MLGDFYLALVLQTFKLQTIINTTSMVLFDADKVLRRYNSPEEILRDFVITRRHVYFRRKKFLIGMLDAESRKLTEQARFIREKIAGNIVMENRKKKAIIARLIEMKFERDPVRAWREAQKQKVRHDVASSSSCFHAGSRSWSPSGRRGGRGDDGGTRGGEH